MHSFIRVRFHAVLKEYANNNLNFKIDYVKEQIQSKYVIKEAIFAVCDFFKPHKCRHQWSFGAVAELWDPECFKYTIQDGRVADYLKVAECLVPLNRIAGKFIPGFFTPEEFDSVEVPMGTDQAPFRVHGPSWTTPMVVMRLPKRVCLNPSNYPS